MFIAQPINHSLSESDITFRTIQWIRQYIKILSMQNRLLTLYLKLRKQKVMSNEGVPNDYESIFFFFLLLINIG